MIVNIVPLQITPEHINDFIDATVKNHDGSIKEPGIIRFDVIQDAHDASRFILYEAFVDDQAVDAHKQTAHYAQWKKTVVDWFVLPREAVRRYTIIRPLTKESSL